MDDFDLIIEDAITYAMECKEKLKIEQESLATLGSRLNELERGATALLAFHPDVRDSVAELTKVYHETINCNEHMQYSLYEAAMLCEMIGKAYESCRDMEEPRSTLD